MTSQVAKTILSQLGGNRFLAMTGAKHLVSSQNQLSMQLPNARHNGKVVNGVRITLELNDTYTVEALRISRKPFGLKVVAGCDNVYCDTLQQTFTRLTGLETHL